MKSVIFGTDNSAPSTSSANYNRIASNFTSSWNSTENQRQTIIAADCDLSKLYVKLSAAPGSGKSYTFTVMKNGVATALEVVISDTATDGTDNTNTVSFTKGDTISLRCTPSGTPTSVTEQYWHLETSDTNGLQPIPFGTSTAHSTSAANYTNLHGASSSGSAWSATEADKAFPMPTPGVFKNLYVKLNTAPGSGKSITFTVMKNGVATSLEVTISDTNTTGSDTTNTVTVAAGDTISLRATPSGTPTVGIENFGIAFDPDTDGESVYSYSSSAAPANNATNYEQPLGLGNNGWNSSENVRQVILGAYRLTKLRVLISTAPGSGKSWDFTVRKAAADTSLTVNIADSNTTANVAADVDFSEGNLFSIESTPNSTPTAMTGGAHIGYVLKITSGGTPVNIQKSLQYTVKVTPSATTKSLKYTIKITPAAVTKGLIYAIKKGIAITKSLQYLIKASVAITKSLKYTIKITPSAVTKTLAYAIKTTPSALTKSLQYVIKAPVAITKNLKYTIKITPSALTKSLQYVVQPAVLIQKTLQYTIKASVAITKSLKYTIRITPSAITKSLQYSIRKGIAITKSLQYAIKSTPSAVTKSLKYTIKITPVALTKSLQYVVKLQTAITKSLKYTVKISVSITKSLKYTIVLTPTALTKSLRYAIRLQTAITKSLQYVIKAPVAITKSLKYTIKITPSALTKSLRYAIRLQTAITKSLQYAIKKPTATTKQLKYGVVKPIAMTKSLTYQINPSVAYVITKQLKYIVKSPKVIVLSLRYHVIYYTEKYVPQGTNYSEKYSTQNTTYGEKYVPQNTTYQEKY